jgi:multimeric flavodoxin WrbA
LTIVIKDKHLYQEVIIMNFCILMGSPRIHGNTAVLLKPFIEELKNKGATVTYITLADKNISPCKGCYACQNVEDKYGCVQKDDVEDIMQQIIDADCVIFATPIYSWYCTPPMKALMDRHFGLNKYYGSASGSLWEGKKCAIITTHGYDAEYGAGPFETGIKRLCEHSKLNYLGMYSARDEDNLASFQTEEVVAGVKEFARQLINN